MGGAAVKYQKIEDPEGKYIGEDGKLYTLLFCNRAIGPKGENINWGKFKTLKSALKKLTLKKL